MIHGLRLLFLLPFAPQVNAAHGGGRLIGQFLTEMTKRHQVAIVYLRSQDEPELDEFFRECCVVTEEVMRPAIGKALPLRLARYKRLLKALIQGQPMWVADWASKVYGQRVQAIAQQFQPDIVQVEYHVMGQYLATQPLCDAPHVLVAHESPTRAAPYLRNLPLFLAHIINRLEKRAWQRYETVLFGQVQAIIAFTEADKVAIKKTAVHTPIYVIQPGFTIPAKSLDPLGSLPQSLLFIGNFIHPPNIEAAMRLIRSIFPAVRAQRPDVTLTIVGDQAPPELQNLVTENIVLTGRVPDTSPYLDQASLFVAPMHSGGGIRIKILEVLAAGKAIVATPLAAEGLNLVQGEQICLAESDEALARKIIDLLANPEKRLSLAIQARAWACEHLGWEQAARHYETIYTTLVEQSR